MGCDIHLELQSRGPDGSWTEFSGAFEAEVYDYEASGYVRQPVSGSGAFDVAYGGRCYDAFAHLAGVRNYNGVTPFSEPRGVPEDLRAQPGFEDRYDLDGNHSHTWYTVEELDAHLRRLAAAGSLPQRGILSWEQYAALKAGTRPNGCGRPPIGEWSRKQYYPDLLEPAQAEAAAAAGEDMEGVRILAEWTEPTEEAYELRYMRRMVDGARAALPGVPDADIRILMSFDS